MPSLVHLNVGIGTPAPRQNNCTEVPGKSDLVNGVIVVTVGTGNKCSKWKLEIKIF